MRASHMRRISVLLLLLALLVMGCHRKAADAFTADIVMDTHVPGAPNRLLKKCFLGSFQTEIGLQVLESSFAEMIEITKLVHFSAAC